MNEFLSILLRIFTVCQAQWYILLFLVSHDVNHNTYHWLRPPHIQKDINLDNHEVDIKEYNFSYVLDGMYL